MRKPVYSLTRTEDEAVGQLSPAEQGEWRSRVRGGQSPSRALAEMERERLAELREHG